MAMNFDKVDRTLQRYVDEQLLPGVSYAVMQGRDVVRTNTIGYSDIASKTLLRHDHLFRVKSNTKLVTTCAVLMLVEDGLIRLNDPIEMYIPALGARKVLAANARSIDDTQLAKGSITIAHLLSHTSGLSYGLFDPGSVLFRAYKERKVLDASQTLAQMIDALADLPLKFNPGTDWEYSVASDVLGRLIEVVSGVDLAQFFQVRIFDPLKMVDTTFCISPHSQSRLASYYRGADRLDSLKPGLTLVDSALHRDAYLKPTPRLSAGGGLVSTLGDMVALIQSLQLNMPNAQINPPQTLLRPATIAMMMSNQLPQGHSIRFDLLGQMVGLGFGFGGAVTQVPMPNSPIASLGEFQWGGIAGTHWWISPNTGLSAVLMTQREMAFWHPFSFDFKNAVYAAAGFEC